MQNKFTIEQVEKHWDDVAEKYERSHETITKETHFQRFEEAKKYLNLKPEMKILNIWSVPKLIYIFVWINKNIFVEML